MNKLLYKDISFQIRGACFWVWKEFGSAFKESIIDKALTHELLRRGLEVNDQKTINVFYQGKKVGIYRPDKIINGVIIIELKAKPYLTKQDVKQFWQYLKATDYKVGFLINFGEKLEIKRVVYDYARHKHINKAGVTKDLRVYPRRLSACRSAGFTLIELLVAMAVFGLVVASIAGVFVSIVNAQRKAAASQETQEASRFLLESMAKEIRMSVVNSNTSSGINITNSEGQTLSYEFSGGRLYRNGQQISPDGIEIINGKFDAVSNISPPATKVTIVMAIKGIGSSVARQTQLNLQTTISTRAQ
jgi:GxxExxY protein